MKKLTKQQKAIMNVIYERAYLLVEEATKTIKALSNQKIDCNALEGAALKQALQEWKENKPVFEKPIGA